MGKENETEQSGKETLQATRIAQSFDRIANLLALLVTHGKPQPEQINLLTGAGYSPAEIASLIGTTANTVSVTLYQLKSAKRKKTKKRG